jgi:metal-dependent amidase/aminoacylase/carboxypeptidase family protein
MAAANRFEIRIRGKGGHAAQPHTTVDPIPIACALVGQLQSLVSRSVDPLDSAVLTVGRIEGGRWRTSSRTKPFSTAPAAA